ncbi:membrane protein insertion efficiency factor YidD [Novacetimonas cocois]|uniref:Putative membrane protein insertion efficiency factor n=2 Tax=Novacetimonas cocois TaxID=1747507 RepID=A0A365Z2Q7_9PROT|nr:membrane protein insertion efficiency factor YidD [Novacetimonas cocois]
MLRGMIRAYQLVIRPVIGANCRFTPSCSHYARDALARHGAWHGGIMSAWRILRCNPWNAGGYDPVPATRRGDRSCRCIHNPE